MRKTIERKVIVNKIFSKSFDESFNVKDNPVFEMYGKITKKEAERKGVEMFGQGTVILNIETSENSYEISVEEFIKNAKIKGDK